MNQTKIIILPLPRMQDLIARWNRIMPQPLDCLPGGIRDLACCALQNPDDFDAYVNDVFFMLEEYANDDLEWPIARRVARLMQRHEFLFMLELMIQSFYDEFLTLALPILGNEKLYFNKVISYHNAAGICVEFSNEPSPRLSYCTAR